MRCISLWQPWSSLIARGAKKLETRGWTTSYLGDLAIHAGKVLDRQMACDDRVLAAMGWSSSHQITYPAGAVLCVVEIYDVVPTSEVLQLTNAQEEFARCRLGDGLIGDPCGVIESSPKTVINEDEYHLGDYSPGRFVWLTRNLRPLKEPVRTRGYQKIWTLDPQVEAKVRAQL